MDGVAGRTWEARMASRPVGALAPIVAGLAGVAWFWLELTPPRLGFDDTDSPEVSLRFLHAHPEVYGQAGAALLVLAAMLVVATFVVADALVERPASIAVRSLTSIGLIAAACFFLHGVLRFSVQPILYIDSLDRDWGEAAFLAVQMAGIHGFAQAGTFALCLWVVGISILGVRAKVVPLTLGLIAAIPAFRIVGLLVGPFATLPDVLWIVGIAAIPVVMLWCVLLGVVLLRRGTAAPPRRALEGAPVAGGR